MAKLEKKPQPVMTEWPKPKNKPRYRWNYRKKRWFYITGSLLGETE